MREILFKAKRLDNGEWIKGESIIKFRDGYKEEKFIADKDKLNECVEDRYGNVIKFNYCNFIKVDPETVCQFTGLTDKNGVKIFEKDIITLGNGSMWVIDFQLNAFVVMDEKTMGRETIQFALLEQYQWDKEGNPIAPDYIEVVGNIFDNPELMEV